MIYVYFTDISVAVWGFAKTQEKVQQYSQFTSDFRQKIVRLPALIQRSSETGMIRIIRIHVFCLHFLNIGGFFCQKTHTLPPLRP